MLSKNHCNLVYKSNMPKKKPKPLSFMVVDEVVVVHYGSMDGALIVIVYYDSINETIIILTAVYYNYKYSILW